MHRGRAYHEFMLASATDGDVRRKFQRLVKQLTPSGATILDFGAGTGIDAKAYAAEGYRVLAYEPCQENRAYLEEYCRHEIAQAAVASTDLSNEEAVQTIAANFAVLNLVHDREELFARFARLLAPGSYVVANLLNPYFLGDARYSWWRKSLAALLRDGSYIVQGEDGPVSRVIPSVLARAAPTFRRTAIHPRGLGLAFSRYLFVVLKMI